jgi:RNA polymerase sigma-70 factor (ECF subfamily)
MATDIAPSGDIVADAELVRRAQEGESDAYDALFRRHYAKVYNFALRLDGSRDNAADIAQTAFVRAWESLSRLRDGQAFLRWVYRIALNLVRDRAKQALRKPWVALRDLWQPAKEQEGGTEPVEFADSSFDPERITTARERDRALAEAITRLPMEFREVVVLHHLQGLDVRQIAEVAGIAEGTVKSRLGRARARLRAALREWMDAGGEEQ